MVAFGEYQVLIVDDEAIIREGLAGICPWHELGFAPPRTAASGIEALALAHAKAPDLLITDIRMPQMDGIELCGQIRASHPDCRIIVLSGFSDFVYAQKLIRYQIDAYLLKPVQEQDLLEVLGKISRDLQVSHTETSGSDMLTQDHTKTAEASLADGMDINRALLAWLRHDLLPSEHRQALIAQHSGLTPAWRLTVLSRTLPDPIEPSEQLLWLEQTRARWNPRGCPVVVLNQQLVLLVANEWVQPSDSFTEELQQFLTWLTAAQDQQADPEQRQIWYAGISMPFCADDRIRPHLEQASTAAAASFYDGPGHATFYQPGSNREAGSEETRKLIALVADTAAAVRQGKIADLSGYTQQFMSHLIRLRPTRREVLITYVVHFCRSTLIQADAAAANHADFTVDQLCQRFGRCPTIDDLRFELRDFMLGVSTALRQSRSSGGHNQLADEISRYIDRHYAQPLSLDLLSGVFHLSAPYLSKIYKAETGLGIAEYVQKIRIAQAALLLKESGARIQDIANQVGYTDYRHFCTVFKKATGHSPLQYRILGA